MIKLKIRLYIEDDDGGFYVYCPELKGLHVGGATLEEAMQNGIDAAQLHIDSLIRHNDPIPLGLIEEEVSPMSALLKALRSFVRPRKVQSRIAEVYVPA